jgi:O-antigen ligase
MGAILGVCGYLLGFGLPVHANVPTALLAASSVVGYRRKLPSSPSPLLAAVTLFLVATALSTVFSIDLQRSLTLNAPLVPGALLFLLLARHGVLRFTEIVFAVVALVTSGVSAAVLAAATRGDWRALHSHVGSVGTPILVEANDIAFVAVLAPLCCAMTVAPVSRRRWCLAAGAIAVSVSAICVLQSRTAFLALLAGISTFVWVTAASRATLCKQLLALLLATAIVDASLGFPLATKFRRTSDQRIAMAFITTRMFADAPLLGHGPHTFADLFGRYRDSTILPAWAPPVRPSHIWAHNLYLELLAERGIVGLMSFVVVIAIARRRLALALRDGDARRRIHAAAVIASLNAFCVAALFESSFLRLWVVIAFFTLAGIAAQLSEERPSS